MLSSLASITGVWSYRVFFTRCRLRKYLVWITITLSIVQSSNLLLAGQSTQSMIGLKPINFAEMNSFAYSMVSELHLMPLMVMAC